MKLIISLFLILLCLGCQSPPKRTARSKTEVYARVIQHFHKIYVWDKQIEKYLEGREKSLAKAGEN